jgi:transposase
VAYREVTMLEIKEVVRAWLAGEPKKRIAARVGLDPKTVRGYIKAARSEGLDPAQGSEVLTEERLADVVAVLHPEASRPRGATWARCEAQRDFIDKHLKARVRLTKIRKLLLRNGVVIPYPTLHRFATVELGFGRRAPTIAVVDGDPGVELQVDTGWVGSLAPNAAGKRRRFRAWIFTPNVSRLRFVYPCWQETTASAIEACEAAWAFYGGIFKVLLPDNTKAIVQNADALSPVFTPTFLEYAQARGFAIDPARVRKPQDKGRTERTVPFVRDDCFGGETLADLEAAQLHALRWCVEEQGLRRHSTTQRIPREHFDAEEKPVLLPAPTEAYDVPIRSSPIVGRDQYAQVARALYSLPTELRRKTLTARADRHLVRFYRGAVLVKTHPRQPPGGRSTDPHDFPPEKLAYAQRDAAFLQRQAAAYGPSVGRVAERILDVPQPWMRMRRVYKLLALGKKYGAARLEDACATALAHDLTDVRRIQRMLELAAPPLSSPASNIILFGRYLRPATQYQLPLAREQETP